MTKPIESMDLAEVLAEFGADEHRVILRLARRLLLGQRQYGKIDLARDPRDWAHERAMELADAVTYAAFAEIAKDEARDR